MDDNKGALKVDPKLFAKDLVKNFKGRCVVNHVSCSLAKGEVVGLLGPNGAGKTTFFSMLAGLLFPDQGDIMWGDVSLTKLPMYMRGRLGIRYLPQEASVFTSMTVAQNLLAILELFYKDADMRSEKMQVLLDEFDLTRLRDLKAASLSGGERRRLEIARSLIGDPHFILLDEPFAGIDPKMVEDIRRLVFDLKKRNIGILITDHSVRETLRIVDRAYILHAGTVLKEGTPDQLVQDEQVRSVYLGKEFLF